MIIIASAAVTRDGYMDDRSPVRLVISDEEDWREVHALRAGCDAILVGAGTLRKDNPALVIRDAGLRRQRETGGKPADIIKIAVSGSGELDPSLRFFTEGAGRKIVITLSDADTAATEKYSPPAEVIRLPEITAKAIAERLSDMGIGKLMVEGGAEILKMFFDEDMADRLRLAVSPHTLEELSGRHDARAPRLPCFGCLPFERSAIKRNHKAGVMNITDYTIHPKADARDLELLQRAIDLSRLCTPTPTAYCVGCVIAAGDGRIFEGYTHESGPRNHAEEEAILKAEAAGADLAGATIYTSMEPCSTRSSKPVSCCELILRHRMERVVYALAEPDRFVRCDSTAILRSAGVEVVVPEGFAEQVAEINRLTIDN
jgi:5-amino-6-(5-phosphoribosylamino)uracil reductase